MIIGKIQMIGDFLDSHGRMAQQVHGYFKSQGQVIVVRSGPVFPFEHVIAPGTGEMDVGDDLVNVQGAVNILFNKAFHGEGRGGFFLMADQGFRKQLDIMMKKEGQFASAVGRIFFHNMECFGEIFSVSEIFYITVGIQMVVR